MTFPYGKGAMRELMDNGISIIYVDGIAHRAKVFTFKKLAIMVFSSFAFISAAGLWLSIKVNG